MENATVFCLPRGRQQQQPESPPSSAPSFLSLPLEVRYMIYEHVIFSKPAREFFFVNPKLDLALRRVNQLVSREASLVLYTRRTAVITILPHQYYLHGRSSPVTQLFRSDIPDDEEDDEDPTTPAAEDDETDSSSSSPSPSPSTSNGLIHPHLLARFSRIRLCLFLPATFQTAYPLVFFDPIAELKSVLEVLRNYDSSPSQPSKIMTVAQQKARSSLEIIVAVYPRPEDEEAETQREARIREDFVRRGVTRELKALRAVRTLKVGGNFTREGLVRFCKVTCGE